MDSRLIPYVLAAGWLLVTLGVWGATGQTWWLWPLSGGAALLVSGLVYLWAFWVNLRVAARKPEEHPGEART